MAKRKKGAHRNRAGMLPGEARRRSLVSVERTVRPGEVADAERTIAGRGA